MWSEKIFAFLTNEVVSRLPAAPMRNCRRSNMVYGSPQVHARNGRADLLLPNVPQRREGHINCATVADRGWLAEPVVSGSLWMQEEISAKGRLGSRAAGEMAREGRRLAHGSSALRAA